MVPVVVVQSLSLAPVVVVHHGEVTADLVVLHMLLLLGWWADLGLHVVFGLGTDGIVLQAAVACQEVLLLHMPGNVVALVQCHGYRLLILSLHLVGACHGANVQRSCFEGSVQRLHQSIQAEVCLLGGLPLPSR